MHFFHYLREYINLFIFCFVATGESRSYDAVEMLLQPRRLIKLLFLVAAAMRRQNFLVWTCVCSIFLCIILCIYIVCIVCMSVCMCNSWLHSPCVFCVLLGYILWRIFSVPHLQQYVCLFVCVRAQRQCVC